MQKAPKGRSGHADHEHVEYAIAKRADVPIPLALEPNRTPKSSTPGQQMCNLQKYDRRHVSFVLPTDIHFDTPQHFEEPTYKGAQKAKS